MMIVVFLVPHHLKVFNNDFNGNNKSLNQFFDEPTFVKFKTPTVFDETSSAPELQQVTVNKCLKVKPTICYILLSLFVSANHNKTIFCSS